MVSVESTDALTKRFRLCEAKGGSSLTASSSCPIRDDVCDEARAGRRGSIRGAGSVVRVDGVSSLDADGSAAALMETLLTEAVEEGLLTDAVIADRSSRAATSGDDAKNFPMPRSTRRLDQDDISVPISDLAEFLARADKVVEQVRPGVRPMPFGHSGDGNVHYNATQPLEMDQPATSTCGSRCRMRCTPSSSV